MLDWLLGMFAARSIAEEISNTPLKPQEPEKQPASFRYDLHFVTLKDESILCIAEPSEPGCFLTTFIRHSGSWYNFNGDSCFTTHGKIGDHVGVLNQKVLENGYQKSRSENGTSNSSR